MSPLQDMTIKDGVLQSNYQFFDPLTIPEHEYEYWANMQFQGRTPSQIIDDFNNSVKNRVPLKAIQIQNSLMAFTRNTNDLTTKQKQEYVSNFGAAIGWGTMLGASQKSILAAGVFASMLDGMCGESDNELLIITMLSIMSAVERAKEFMDKLNETNGLYDKYEIEIKKFVPIAKIDYLKPKYEHKEVKVYPTPKPRPYF